MKEGVEVAKKAIGSMPMPMKEGVRSQRGYADEGEPMRGFIVIDADTKIDRWMFSIFVKICLM